MITRFRERLKKTDLSLGILALAVLAQILLWVRMNLKYQYIFDYDASMLFYHVISMWKEKTLLIPDWIYMSTGEWDCASLPAFLFYGLTGDIKLSFGMANACNVVLVALVVSRVFQAIPVERGRNKGMLLGISLLLMPYCWGMLDYSNMLFYGAAQYIYKVLLPVWLISLYVGMPKRKPLAILYTVGFLIPVWATASSSGIYVFMCGLFPVLCCWLVRAIGSPCFDRKGFLISLLTVGAYVAGFVFRKVENLQTLADLMMLSPMEDIFPNLLQTIKDYFYVIEVLPAWTQLEIFSFEAIMGYLKLGVLLVMTAMGIRELKHCFMLRTVFTEPERVQDAENFAKASLSSVFVWNLFILIMIKSTPRYHLIGFIPFIILGCISLAQKLEACPVDRVKNLLWMGFALAAVLLAGLLFFDARNHVTDEKEQYSQLIISEAEAQDVDTVILLDDGWWAERTRPLDPERRYLGYSSSLGEMINFNVPASFNDMNIFSERHMLITQKQYPIERLPESMRERYTLVKDEWNIQYYIAEDITEDQAESGQ